MFNNEMGVFIPYEVHEKLYEHYEPDIHKMAFEFGGANCSKCMKTGGNNCETCKTNETYLFKDQEING